MSENSGSGLRLGLRLFVIAGILLVPAGFYVFLTEGLAQQHHRSQQALGHRLNEVEQRLAAQNKRLDELSKQLAALPVEADKPEPKLGESLPGSRVPGSLRAQRRLALIETLIRWVRQPEDEPELAHVGAGMAVAWGPAGQLVALRSLVDPWIDESRAKKRDEVLRQGGRAAVLYRVWNSGVSVLDATGTVDRSAARVFDEPMDWEPYGEHLVLLSGADFPPESVDPGGPVRSGQAVTAYRWPEEVKHGLPGQTRPLSEPMRFGDPSPAQAKGFLFDSEGQLRGFIDPLGRHLSLPSHL